MGTDCVGTIQFKKIIKVLQARQVLVHFKDVESLKVRLRCYYFISKNVCRVTRIRDSLFLLFQLYKLSSGQSSRVTRYLLFIIPTVAFQKIVQKGELQIGSAPVVFRTAFETTVDVPAYRVLITSIPEK